MKEQVEKYLSGNEAAALAVKQIGYDIMGYYPILLLLKLQKIWI